jgi:hypothetical protein
MVPVLSALGSREEGVGSEFLKGLKSGWSTFFFLPRPKLLGGKSVSQLSYGLCAAVVGRHAEALNQMR